MTAPALKVYVNGTTNDPVSSDNLNSFQQTCDTFANLRAFIGATGVQVFTRGGAAIDDGNQGAFYWSSTSTAVDDNNNVIRPNGLTVGAWLRISSAISNIFTLFSSPPPLGNVTPNLVYSSGGALNGTIGVVTPAEGHFTTVAASTSVTGGTGSFSVALAAGIPTLKATGNYVNVAGSSIAQNFIATVGSMTGTLSNGSYVVHLAQVQSDNISLGSTGTPEVVGFGSYYTFGGTSVTGARAAGRYALVLNANTNNTIDSFHRGLAVTAYMSALDGGTAGTYRGKWFGGIFDSALLTGANYVDQIRGLEIDTTVGAGIAVNYKNALLLAKKSTDGARGVLWDAAFAIADQPSATVGWLKGLVFGSPLGVWAFRSDSTLIGTDSTALGGSAYVANLGVDLSAVTFTTAAWKSTGLTLDPFGHVWSADWNSVYAQGAVGNGSTNDTTALNATASVAYLPKGTFALSGSMTTLTGNKRFASAGTGGILQSVESAVTTKQSGNYAAISTAPVDGSSSSYIFTAYNGDFSNVHMTFQTYISGAATLTQPATGFYYARSASGISGTLLNTSGWNQSTSTNDGRTAVELIDLTYTHSGNGGTGGISVSGFVNGAKAGATSFLANPAGTVLVGGVTAGADGVYLQAIGDLGVVDNGHDVAAAGAVFNFNRTVGTGALGVTWMGVRLQSTGTVAIDAFHTMKGPARIGMDLSTITLQDLSGTATKSAITMKAGMAIYGNATNADSTLFPRYTVAGTEWLSYETSTGWNLVVGSNPIVQANATAFKTTGGQIIALRVVTAAGGVTVTTSDNVVVVNKTVGAATAVSLPATPETGRIYEIKDGKGDAATNNITITPAAGTIDGAATLVLNQNYESVLLVYNGTEWNII